LARSVLILYSDGKIAARRTGSTSARHPGRLHSQIAGWPGRCEDSEELVRKDEPMVFSHGQDACVRWCVSCAATLAGEITPRRAYLRAFGDDDRVGALRATARHRRAARADWRQEVRHPRALRGRRVRIRRGAAILSDTGPRAGAAAVARRAQVVKVHQVLIGFERDDGPAKPTTFRWAGAGGYLPEGSVEDIVEIVE
jgi:hypothetical protein